MHAIEAFQFTLKSLAKQSSLPQAPASRPSVGAGVGIPELSPAAWFADAGGRPGMVFEKDLAPTAVDVPMLAFVGT